MPQSLSNILLHLVFSTKNRQRFLTDEIRDDLHAYMGGIIANHHGQLLAAGSVEDHIHLLLDHSRTISIADMVKEIKISTSGWLKEQSSHYSKFHWQTGYGVFSISPAHKKIVTAYIHGQKEHHHQASFQDEFRRLLQKYGVKYDERYVWD